MLNFSSWLRSDFLCGYTHYNLNATAIRLQCERSVALKWDTCAEEDKHHTRHFVLTEVNVDLAKSHLLQCRIVKKICIFEWHKGGMKCNMTRQTEVALQNIGYLSNIRPHMKVSWFGFERNRTCAVQTVKNWIWVAYRQKGKALWLEWLCTSVSSVFFVSMLLSGDVNK